MSQLFGMENIITNLTKNKVTPASEMTKNVKNTIGNPTLSKDASNYYETLKEKHSDVEFVLVSEDQKTTAKETATNINSNKSMIVLISEDEVEQMASDETVQNKNEQIITDAKAQMPSLMEQLKESGTNVKSFGMEFDDNGNATYFAVLDNSRHTQKERIENTLAEKRAEKKADTKEAEEKAKESKKEISIHQPNKPRSNSKENLTTVTASSMDALIQKIQTNAYASRADYVMTAQEKMIGQGFDFSI